MGGGSRIKTWSCQLYLTCEAALRDCYGCVVNSWLFSWAAMLSGIPSPLLPTPYQRRQDKKKKSLFTVVFSVVFQVLWVENGSYFVKTISVRPLKSLTCDHYQSSQCPLPPTPQSGGDHWFLWKKAHFPVIAYRTSWGEKTPQDQLGSSLLFPAHLCNPTSHT